MALKSAKDIEYKDQVISIRMQEIYPEDLRPDEIDLVEEGLCADSIGDIPIPGDYLGLRVQRYIKDKDKYEERGVMFKVLTRYFSLDSMIGGHSMSCTIVVTPVLDDVEKGKVMKD